MGNSLRNRTALVTGGGRGIGRSISEHLAGEGAVVAINFRNDSDSANQTLHNIETKGGIAKTFKASIENEKEVQTMLNKIQKDLGNIDILINNAGIASSGRSVEKTEPEELLRVMRIHALAPHRMCQLVLPAMKKKRKGNIIMISSVATLGQAAGGAPYNMGKSAMESLALTLAKEVRKYDIRVNIVAPGIVETEMGDRLIQAVVGVDSIQEIARQMPFERLCQPQDVANVVRFLVSEEASYITGEKINVWGGGETISGMA